MRGPFLCGPLFGRTCWTCLNPPLWAQAAQCFKWRGPAVKWAHPIFNTSEIAYGMCTTFLGCLAFFVVPVLSCASFSSSLLALGGMLAHNSNNIWCLQCYPGWQAAAALLGWGEEILMMLWRMPWCHRFPSRLWNCPQSCNRIDASDVNHYNW